MGGEAGGECLHIATRLVLAPMAGRYRSPGTSASIGTAFESGAELGEVVRGNQREPVVVTCGGVLAGLLAHEGEPVRQGQPIAWLHVAGSDSLSA